MVLIDVDFPALGETMNFRVDETVPISGIIDELSSLVCQKLQESAGFQTNCFLLCNADTQEILNPEKKLAEYGIENGTRLLLV